MTREINIFHPSARELAKLSGVDQTEKDTEPEPASVAASEAAADTDRVGIHSRVTSGNNEDEDKDRQAKLLAKSQQQRVRLKRAAKPPRQTFDDFVKLDFTAMSTEFADRLTTDQGWKFMSCSHCQDLCQQASLLLIGCTRVIH